MKTFLFIAIVLLSGFLAGTGHGLANLIFVEPYLDEAIGIENQNLFSSGQEEDTPEFQAEYESYRIWQKGGQVLAGSILGTSMGALFGIVFALSKKVLPGDHHIKKALVLSGLMWTTIYLIPFLKYPANPPTVGDADTVVLRSILYLSFIAISGLGAVGFYQIFKRLQNRKRIVAILGYALFVSAMFVLMPDNPDKVTAPMDLVSGFRIMSVVAVSIFWIANGIILGAFWQKYNPEKSIQTKTQ
ncbi:MAG: CbtA family protein [Nitrosopumilaceae archaeon]